MLVLHPSFRTLQNLLLALACLCCISAEEPFKCPEQFGYYRDGKDCSKYYVCVFGDSHHEKCTGGLHFSLELQTCDWPRNVNCLKDETITEEKVVEYVEDEIFSSSRRTSATASSDKAQAPLKPQAVERDPASNYHPYEDKNETKDHTKNNGEPPKETKNSRQPLENSQYPQRITTTTPEPTTSNTVLDRQSTTGEKSKSDSLESSSEDPLYANDERAKVPLDNYDPQEPKFDEAAPPLIDSEGGIHIADGGHGLDAFGGLAHLPGLGDFRVFEKPVYNANNGKEERDQDYQKKNKESTLSTVPRKLEDYPNSNGDLKDPDVIIDYSNGNKELTYEFEERKRPLPTPPPTIFDDNADHRDYGGFDIITPSRNKNQNDENVNERPEDRLQLTLIVPVPDFPRLHGKQDEEAVKAEISHIERNFDNIEKINFDVNRNLKHNTSVPKVQFDDHPSGYEREISAVPQNVQNRENSNRNKDVDRPRTRGNSEKTLLDIFNNNNGKSRDPDVQFSPVNVNKEPEYENFDLTDILHEPVRNSRTRTKENGRPSPENDSDELSGDSFKIFPTSAKDLYPDDQKSFLEEKQDKEPNRDRTIIFPAQPLDKDFGTYTGSQRQSKKLDSLPEDQSSQSVSDNRRENIPTHRRPSIPIRQPDKIPDPNNNKERHPEKTDTSIVYDDYDLSKSRYTGDHNVHDLPEITTRTTPVIRSRPTRPRKSTTTTTTTTTTPAPIKIRTRQPISQIPKATRAPAASTTANPPFRPINQYPTPQPFTQAQKCDPRKCRLPDCRCGGTDIPEGLRVNEVPQLVLLTFDDAVNDLNNDLYEELFDTGRANPNGCPILGTFYVSHEWTDYGQVQTLYSKGHEIASHSITHSYGEKFSKNQWMREIHGQREILHLYGGVKMEDIRGMRAPFLQIGGNKMFEMLFDANFTYDSSMPVYENNPPFWPYTLDYAQSHECMIFPCPTKSFPGLWEVGMVMWVDLRGGRCSMGDACSNPQDEEAVTKMLMKNFNRHYKSNRAPFGLFYHSAWFNTQHHRRGFMKFLDEILQKDDVWLVTNWQLIQWMRNPTPISELHNFEPFNCRKMDRPPACPNPTVCNVWYQGGVRYMKTCQPCPVKYPWVGNTGYDNSNRG